MNRGITSAALYQAKIFVLPSAREQTLPSKKLKKKILYRGLWVGVLIGQSLTPGPWRRRTLDM
jgi:hypothetical protein